MAAVDPTVVELGGQKYIWDSSTMIVKTLSAIITTTTGVTLDDDAGADYQVPTGKKFVALEVNGTNTLDTAKTETIYSSTAADGTTGEVDKLFIVYPAAVSGVPVKINVNFEIAADLFLTSKVSSATGEDPALIIVGIEMDA